jgi:addiction module RelB/DinJ family antitoxin
LVDQASKILDYIGLNTTDAVRILLKSIVNTGGLPIDLKKPRTVVIPENLPTLQLSEAETAQIEQKLDDYYAGKLKTTTLSNPQDIKNYFIPKPIPTCNKPKLYLS